MKPKAPGVETRELRELESKQNQPTISTFVSVILVNTLIYEHVSLWIWRQWVNGILTGNEEINVGDLEDWSLKVFPGTQDQDASQCRADQRQGEAEREEHLHGHEERCQEKIMNSEEGKDFCHACDWELKPVIK